MPIRFNISWLMIAVAIVAILSALAAYGLLPLALAWVATTIWIMIPGLVARRIRKSRQAHGRRIPPGEWALLMMGSVIMSVIFGICLITFLAFHPIRFL